MAKVLIIEDEKQLAEGYKAFLQRKGHNVEAALDATEGFDKANNFAPDLILLDMRLPQKINQEPTAENGLHLLKNLKNGESTKNTPVIIISNLEKSEAIPCSHKDELDVVEYIVKINFSLEDMAAKVEKYASPWCNKKILVIEDDMALLSVIIKTLENNYFNVLTASSVSEALSVVSTHPDIAAIWTDHHLQKHGTGYEVLKKIKGSADFISIPSFLVSGSVPKEILPRYLKLGVSYYFQSTDSDIKKIVDDIKAILSTVETKEGARQP